MKDQGENSKLQEIRHLHRGILEVIDRIHTSTRIKQLLVDLKGDILNILKAQSVSIYLKERRKVASRTYIDILVDIQDNEHVVINNNSIAGYAALTKSTVNVADAYDTEELKNIDKQIAFGIRWDKKSSIKTKQCLVVPILYERALIGVIQIRNRKDGGNNQFTEEEIAALQGISQVLGLTFHRIRNRKSRFDHLLTENLLKEIDLDCAWEESREAKESMETFLMKKYNIAKGDVGKSLAEFYRCKYVSFDNKLPIPTEIIKNFRSSYFRLNYWVPIGMIDGNIHVLVTDPNNKLQCDLIEIELKTKAVTYSVALVEDIFKYIEYFYSQSDKPQNTKDG